MLDLFRRHKALTIAFLLALAATLFFSVRLVMATLLWPPPEMPDQPIAGWMTPRYVAHSWHLPPRLVAETLDLRPDGMGRRVTLKDIAASQGRSVDAVIADLQAAIARHRAEKP